MPHPAIILLSKYPTPGQVKTRLAAQTSPTLAAAIQKIFLLHTYNRLKSYPNLYLSFAPPDARSKFQTLLDPNLNLLQQCDGSLGDRMAHALLQLKPAHDLALFLATDSPDLPRAHLDFALANLAPETALLGPSPDGGFWTLGVPTSTNLQNLFSPVHWSSGNECRQLLLSASQIGFKTLLAPEWDDVDRLPDLHRLLHRLQFQPDQQSQHLLRELLEVIAIDQLKGPSNQSP